MGEFMIYGANGYTGRLVLDAAVKRGLHPIVAGRNADAVRELAAKYDLPSRAFDLSNADTAASALSGIPLVLHCAGPFSATAAPMLEACLRTKTHYTDITGEIDVFAHCHAQHERAKAAGIAVIPGVGFDVVPTDCLAAMLARELPNSTQLVLAFEAAGGLSPGPAKTSVEGLGKGGRIRKDGQLVTVPLAYKDRTFLRAGKPRTAITIPWGDVYTAYVSTGIPNVEVYTAVPPSTITRLRRLRKFKWFLGLKPVQDFMKRKIEKTVPGPSDELRAKSTMHLWGEISHPSGKTAAMELDTPNGYDITVTAALGIVQRLLSETNDSGYYTPSQLMGADYVLSLPGVTLTRT